MLRTPAVTLATLALVALAGCGSTDESNGATKETTGSSAPKVTVAAAPKATGKEITGTGYTYNAPEGWDIPDPTPGFDPDSRAADLMDEDGFVDNVNVIKSPAGKVTPDQIEDTGVKELESMSPMSASDITINDRITIAGSESAHLSAKVTMGAIEYTVDQFYVTGDYQTFVVTFSFSTDVSAEDRDTLTDATLASWTWTD